MRTVEDLVDRSITRRTMLGGAAALAATPAFAQAPAVPAPATAPRVKGPRVFLDYDQAELDAAYDQSVYAPNLQQIVKRYGTNSDITRQRLGAPERVAYGPTEHEKLDIYKTKRANAPIHVFIHGGAWRSGLAKDYAFPAETFVNAGAHYIAIDFINVGQANGSLMPMGEQCRKAIAWVYKNAASFGGDASRLYISGHSSGGHLAGVVLVTDWQKEFGLPTDTVKGAVSISGLYDLKGPRLSARSSYVKFDDAMEQALSAQRHLQQLNTPVTLVYGTLETPEFQRQTRDFAAALKAANKPAQLIVGDGYNHFEIMETLASPYGLAGRAALEQMKLTGA
jgi:arylformamidase